MSMTSQEDAQSGAVLGQKSDGGAAYTLDHGLPPGTLQSKTQAITDSTTAVRVAEFDPPIKAASISVRHTAAADVTLDDGILVCFGAPSALVGASWLNEANVAPRVQIMANNKEDVYFNGDLISFIDMIGVGTAPTVTVTVGGIS